MGRFEGKVAVVAGGARGLGERFAQDFVGEGGCVAIADVNAGLGSELAAKLGNDKAVFVGTDVTDPAQCANAVDAAWKEFGSLDYLVNSAIAINGGELIDLPLDKWRLTIDIGLTGTFLMGQAFARRMVLAKRKGAVVNLSSVSAFHPYGGSGAYSTVKAAIIHLTELMAVEWAPHGIRVNAVAPGTVETPLTVRDSSSGELLQSWEYRQGNKVISVKASGRLVVSEFATMIGACLAGTGIARVKAIGVQELLTKGLLIDILPDWPGEAYPLYVLYHLPAAKVRAFIDFVVGEVCGQSS